jgi:hypothetical protein
MFKTVYGFLIGASLLLLYPLDSFASHTFETEHADAPGKGNICFVVESETGQEGGHEKHYGIPVMEVVFGLGKWTSLAVGYEYQFITGSEEVHSTSGNGDVEIEFKHSPFHLRYGDIGARVGVKIPSASDDKELGTGETDFEFILIYSYVWEKITTHLNLGVEVLGNPDHRSQHEPLFKYSAVSVFPLHPRVEFFTEIEGHSGKSVFGCESLFRSGFMFPLGHGFEIGLAGAVGLTNNSDDWEAKTGIYWTWERGEKVSH